MENNVKFYLSCIVGFLLAILILAIYVAYNSYITTSRIAYLYDKIESCEKLPD